MKVEYSKAFVKAIRKLSGKTLESLRKSIQEVIDAQNINQISDCKKLTDFDYVYRIRIGDYRAFFTFDGNESIMFEYFLPRGNAYRKKSHKQLRKLDK